MDRNHGSAEPPLSSLELVEAERHLLMRIAAVWRGGWQPRELVRQIRRSGSAATLGLVLVAIAADLALRDAGTLDARWVAQLEELELPRVVAGDTWLADWGRSAGLTPAEIIGVATLLGFLIPSRPLAILIPPPGAGSADGPIVDLTARGNDPMLNRVRALLAQAESTNFEAEAETFTAKAQQLMTRHAIDMAMVAASAERSLQPDTIRVPIDEPYFDAKSRLLGNVAHSSRCRAVFHPGIAMCTVVGFADDLAATEMLFTSLLVQAQVALQGATGTAPPGTRARSRSFRAAFLYAYAYRVSERLEEINAYVVAEAEAETGSSILPVLAARSSVIDAAIDEMFGTLRRSTSRRALDPVGWASGVSAADRARLNHGDLGKPASV
jgi:hypothetical protein